MKRIFTLLLFLFPVFISGSLKAQGTFARTYGSPNEAEVTNAGQQTSDGGYILAGNSSSGGIVIVKTDSWGDTLWTKGVAGKTLFGVKEIPGGFIFTGGPHIFLLKTDLSGNIVWAKSFSSNIDPSSDFGYSVVQTADGGFVITGQKNYNPNTFNGDICLIKTDSSGNLQWLRLLTSGLTDCSGRSVKQTTDGGYIVGGNSYNGMGTWSSYDFCLIKTDTSGTIQWQKYFGSDPLLGHVDRAYSVQQTTDGGYIAAGTYSESFSMSGYLVKTDANGDTLWTRNYGMPSQGFEFRSVCQTSDGGYVMTGPSTTDLVILKTNPAGDTLWTRIVDGSDATMSFFIQQTSDGGYAVMGSTAAAEFSGNQPNGYDHFLIKTDSLGNFPDPTAASVPGSERHISLYVFPVPTKDFVALSFENPGRKKITAQLFSSYGEMVRTYGGFQGNKLLIKKEDLAGGCYFFLVYSAEELVSKGKIIFE